MIWVHLGARLFLLAAIALVAYAYYWTVSFGIDHGRPCVAVPSPVVVHVSARDVAYARARRWPRELSRGSRRWAVVAGDRSATGRRVVARSRGFCETRRFRLGVR